MCKNEILTLELVNNLHITSLSWSPLLHIFTSLHTPLKKDKKIKEQIIRELDNTLYGTAEVQITGTCV